MSESAPRTNSRLDNFDANKRAHEQAAFEASLYGEAGATDFSDEARARVEEADAYERHMETLQARPEAGTLDHLAPSDGTENPYYAKLQAEANELNQVFDAEKAAADSAAEAELEATMQADVRVRQMVMIAESIAETGSTQVTPENDARLSQELKDKEDRLEELLLKFSETSDLSERDTQAVMDRIINMTEAQPTSSPEAPVEADEQDEQEDDEHDTDTPDSSEPTHDEEASAPTPEETEEETQSVQSMSDDAIARLNARAEEMEQEAAERRNGSEQAKADRELLEPVSTDGLEHVEASDAERDDDELVSTEGLEPVGQPNETSAEEGESLEEYEARNGIEAGDAERDEAAAEEERSARRGRWDRLKYLMTPAGFADEMRHRKEKRAETRSDEANERDKRSRAALLVGGAAVLATGVAGAYLWKNYGVETGSGSGGNWLNDLLNDSQDSVRDAADQAAEKAERTAETEPGTELRGGNAMSWNDFDPSARDVVRGEGWYSTFQQMNIPKEHWADVLETAGPNLGELGEAYYDNGAQEWRISQTGKLSGDALKVIAAASKRDGFELNG